MTALLCFKIVCMLSVIQVLFGLQLMRVRRETDRLMGIHVHRRSVADVHKHCGDDFPCMNSTQCVPQNDICDGTPDCDNGSDEWEEEECYDWNLFKMYDAYFGSKEDDSEEDDDDDGGGGDGGEDGNNTTKYSHVRIETSCEPGTYPEMCDCFTELQTGSQNNDLGNASETSPSAGNDTTNAGRVARSTAEHVVGVRLECNDRGLEQFPRLVPKHLISIDVSDNKITELKKDDFANMPELRQLLLSRNKLVDIEEGAFEILTELQTLRMIACDLVEIPQGMFSTMTRLTTLVLSYNKQHTLTKGSLDGLHRLEYLDIRGNGMTEVQPGTFDDVGQLLTLHLSRNQLSSLPASILQPLKHLWLLNIDRNGITVIEPGAFSAQTNLRVLNIGDNKMTAIKRDVFHNLTNLTTLTLRNNTIDYFEDRSLDGMRQLQTLTLTQNPFTTLPVGLFDRLINLKAIYFDHFSLCGYAPHVRLCMPKSDGISTVENLLGNNLLRSAVWIVALLAAVGNAFVLLARCFVREDKKSHSFFIMNLAVADLLMGLYLFIIGVHDVIFRGAYIQHDLLWRSSSMCKLSGVLSLLSSEVSILTMTVITLDRFLSIVHPFRFKNRSLAHARLLMVVVWSVGAGLAALPVLHVEYFGEFYYGGNGVCLPLQFTQPFASGWEFSLAVFVVFNLTAFAFIAYAYLMMFVTIRRSNLAMRSTKKNQDWALMKRFTLIVATDCLCWMPIIIVKFLALGGVTISHNLYAWIAVFILPINSALNPILYTMTTAVFKQKVMALLGIVGTQRKKGYHTGVSVVDTSVSKTSGTRLSIISNKSRGGSLNGKLSSNKQTKHLVECTESSSTTSDFTNGVSGIVRAPPPSSIPKEAEVMEPFTYRELSTVDPDDGDITLVIQDTRV